MYDRPSGKLAPLLAALIIGLSATAPSGALELCGDDIPAIDGGWSGTLVAGEIALPLELELSQEEGALGDIALASPAQNAFGIEGSYELRDCSIRMVFPSIGAEYEAAFTRDPLAMSGQWMQGMTEFPLELVPDRSAEALPGAPTVRREAITFRSDGNPVELTGEITSPLEGGNGVGVMLLSGSGAQDLDQSVYGHRPFALWAEHLSNRGATVLRFNDRGVNGSGGDVASATLEDLTSDAVGAAHALPLTVTRLYLVGQSEGGVVAAMAAARLPSVSGVVLLSPQVAPLQDLLLHQVQTYMEAVGRPPAEIRDALAAQTHINAIVVQEDNVDRRKALVLDELLRLGDKEAVAAAKADAAIAEGFRNRLEADPQQAYSALRVPVLAVFGARDTQIRPIWSADALRSTFRSSGLTSCILVFDELNDLLQTAQTGMPDEYGTIEEDVAAPVLAAVGDWIHHIPTVGPECPEP